MTDVGIVAGFTLGGVVLAWLAWRKLEAEEHDVLHTHPKLVVALIICGSLILGVQGLAVRLGASAQRDGAESLRLVRSATDPKGEVAKAGQQQQIVVVADIEDVSIAAAACAQANAGVDAIRSCVIEQVEARQGDPPILTKRPTTTRGG